MKCIELYKDPEFKKDCYTDLGNGIYKKTNEIISYKNIFSGECKTLNYELGFLKSLFKKKIVTYEDYYFLSVSFIQEAEYGEEISETGMVSQYPLEDILDKFFCFVSDNYIELNYKDKKKSYIMFCSCDLENLKKLSTIIGKHVYNKTKGEYVDLIIE